MKVAKRISLTEEERTTLNVWLRLPMSARLVVRLMVERIRKSPVNYGQPAKRSPYGDDDF